jgi:hypothetical protein
MKKNTQIFQSITALLICMLPLSSCIKDNVTNCPKHIRLYFTFLPHAGNNAANPADVDIMHVYAFNDKGRFVSEYRDGHITHFNADYYIDCSDLRPGKYRFIAWCGKDEQSHSITPASFIKGQTTFDEAQMKFEHPEYIVSTSPHYIFHAELTAAVVSNQDIQRFYLPLTQISNIINIRTVGLPSDANVYTFNIADDNCTYKFDCSFASHSLTTFTYTAPCTKDEAGQLNSTLNMLRLTANRRTPQLQIYNETTGTVLYPVGKQSGDLIGLILNAYPQNDFETTHTYDIVLTFSGDESTGFTITVAVNGWQVRNQNGELIE